MGLPAHRAGAAPALPDGGEPGNRPADPARGETHRAEAVQAGAQPVQAPSLRAGASQPDVAERHLHLPAGRTVCLPHRVSRRLLALYRGGGDLPQPDRAVRHRGLPAGHRRIRRAQGNAHRQREAICHLAGDEPLPEGNAERPGRPHPFASAAPHDPRQDRALLGEHLAGVPRAGPVRGLRGGPGADTALDPVLQPQAAPPGAPRALSGRPLLRDPARAAQDPRGGHPRERAGDGPAGPTRRALLHGGPDAGPVGRAPRREGQTQTARRGRRHAIRTRTRI